METTLVKLAATERALAQAQTIIEVKEIRDQAEALKQYIKLAGQGLEMQNWVAEIKIRAERKAGKMLEEIIPANGGRPPKNLDSLSGFSPRPTLKELGISYHQSKRWRLEAKVPEDIFDEYVAFVKAEGEELTSADILRLAKRLQQREAAVSSPTVDKSTAKTDDQTNCLYQDELLTIWEGVTEPPYILVDNSLTVTVTNGRDVTRYYVLEAAPGFRLSVEENQLVIQKSLVVAQV